MRPPQKSWVQKSEATVEQVLQLCGTETCGCKRTLRCPTGTLGCPRVQQVGLDGTVGDRANLQKWQHDSCRSHCLFWWAKGRVHKDKNSMCKYLTVGQKSCIQILNLGYHNRHTYMMFIFVMWRHARTSRKTQARRKVRARLAQVFPCTSRRFWIWPVGESLIVRHFVWLKEQRFQNMSI